MSKINNSRNNINKNALYSYNTNLIKYICNIVTMGIKITKIYKKKRFTLC